MYQLPSTDGVEQVVINSDVVKNKRKPLLIFGNKKNKINSSA
jgi:ATP-dependent protease Clp ATPase subunit